MKNKFEELYKIVEKLRDPDKGCPWDLKQTAKSLIPNFIEELYECVEAIDHQDWQHLSEELGDLLLHIVMQMVIASENKHFTPETVIEQICQKLINRHPHIFSDLKVQDAQTVKLNWEKIKLAEKKKTRNSVLDGIPLAMPALITAQRTQEKAASVGFDWDHTDPVFDKLTEETEELKQAIANNHPENIEEEIGDLLFTIVNLSRKLGFDAETALKMSTRKFTKRFKMVEEHYRLHEKDMENSGLEELDEVWDSIKPKAR